MAESESNSSTSGPAVLLLSGADFQYPLELVFDESPLITCIHLLSYCLFCICGVRSREDFGYGYACLFSTTMERVNRVHFVPHVGVLEEQLWQVAFHLLCLLLVFVGYTTKWWCELGDKEGIVSSFRVVSSVVKASVVCLGKRKLLRKKSNVYPWKVLHLDSKCQLCPMQGTVE